jgi:DNA-binding response OmpR family regulator
MLQQPSKPPMRVVVVEDDPTASKALVQLLLQTPENDIVCVGEYTENSDDLPERVTEKQADIALVDLVLAPGMYHTDAQRYPHYWGIAAIRALRQKGNPSLKIIAYSQWTSLKNEAVDAGADEFLSKATQPDDLRQMMRFVMKRTDVRPADPHDIGRIMGIALFPISREFIVRGERRDTDLIGLEAPSFALLLYLTHERQQGDKGWLTRVPSDDKVTRYCMTRPDQWRAGAQHDVIDTDNEPGHEESVIFEGPSITSWTSKINTHQLLCRWTTNSKEILVVQGPRVRKHLRLSYYTLNEAIPSAGVVIHHE